MRILSPPNLRCWLDVSFQYFAGVSHRIRPMHGIGCEVTARPLDQPCTCTKPAMLSYEKNALQTGDCKIARRTNSTSPDKTGVSIEVSGRISSFKLMDKNSGIRFLTVGVCPFAKQLRELS